MLLAALAGFLMVGAGLRVALRTRRMRGPSGGPVDLRRAGPAPGPSALDVTRRAQGRTSWTRQG